MQDPRTAERREMPEAAIAPGWSTRCCRSGRSPPVRRAVRGGRLMHRRAKILLVDDRPENLVALEAVLEPLGDELVARRLGRGGAAAPAPARLRGDPARRPDAGHGRLRDGQHIKQRERTARTSRSSSSPRSRQRAHHAARVRGRRRRLPVQAVRPDGAAGQGGRLRRPVAAAPPGRGHRPPGAARRRHRPAEPGALHRPPADRARGVTTQGDLGRGGRGQGRRAARHRPRARAERPGGRDQRGGGPPDRRGRASESLARLGANTLRSWPVGSTATTRRPSWDDGWRPRSRSRSCSSPARGPSPAGQGWRWAGGASPRPTR